MPGARSFVTVYDEFASVVAFGPVARTAIRLSADMSLLRRHMPYRFGEFR